MGVGRVLISLKPVHTGDYSRRIRRYSRRFGDCCRE